MGFAQAGEVIRSGDNLALSGVKPLGVATQGVVAYRTSPAATWTLLSSASIVQPTTTSAPIDTTASNLLVVVISGDRSSFASVSVSDSQNNTWTKAVAIDPGSQFAYGACSAIFYCINPQVSTQHTITASYTCNVLVFKTPPNIVAGQSSSKAGRSITSLSLPAITPVSPNNLVIAGAGSNTTVSTINGNFTIAENIPFTPAVTYACAAAYQVNTGTVAPTWTLAANTDNAGASATMLCFNPS